MNLVDSINRLFLKRLRRSRSQISVAGDRLAVDDVAIPLPSLAGAVAFNADVYAGVVAALALSFSDGRTYTVTQEDACWNDLVAALDRLKLTGSPSSDWLIALAAGDQNTHPIILRRNPGTIR
ncbi:hypothetical protein [Bradyrhizobium genosp. A]|uniref:hypothetical protein n=1 Tax=Bradyrhizobium genosp. A TaxID=83626 RepID=UPI003CEE600F